MSDMSWFELSGGILRCVLCYLPSGEGCKHPRSRVDRSIIVELSRQYHTECQLGHAVMPDVSRYPVRWRQGGRLLSYVSLGCRRSGRLRDMSWFVESGSATRSGQEHIKLVSGRWGSSGPFGGQYEIRGGVVWGMSFHAWQRVRTGPSGCNTGCRGGV